MLSLQYLLTAYHFGEANCLILSGNLKSCSLLFAGKGISNPKRYPEILKHQS